MVLGVDGTSQGPIYLPDPPTSLSVSSRAAQGAFWRQTLREALLTPGPFQLGRFGALAKAVMADVDAVLQVDLLPHMAWRDVVGALMQSFYVMALRRLARGVWELMNKV